MAERHLDDRSRWITLDGAWFRQQVREALVTYFAPFVGAGRAVWRVAKQPLHRP